MIYRLLFLLFRALSRLSQVHSLLVLLNKADYAIVSGNLFGKLALRTLQPDVGTEEQQLLDDSGFRTATGERPPFGIITEGETPEQTMPFAWGWKAKYDRMAIGCGALLAKCHRLSWCQCI